LAYQPTGGGPTAGRIYTFDYEKRVMLMTSMARLIVEFTWGAISEFRQLLVADFPRDDWRKRHHFDPDAAATAAATNAISLRISLDGDRWQLSSDGRHDSRATRICYAPYTVTL
jgi:hypothetical protein